MSEQLKLIPNLRNEHLLKKFISVNNLEYKKILGKVSRFYLETWCFHAPVSGKVYQLFTLSSFPKLKLQNVINDFSLQC